MAIRSLPKDVSTLNLRCCLYCTFFRTTESSPQKLVCVKGEKVTDSKQQVCGEWRMVKLDW